MKTLKDEIVELLAESVRGTVRDAAKRASVPVHARINRLAEQVAQPVHRKVDQLVDDVVDRALAHVAEAFRSGRRLR